MSLDYQLEKLREEYISLDTLWTKLEVGWEKPSDFEDLYKIYPLLLTTATLCRQYLGWENKEKKKPSFLVNTIKEALKDVADTSKYYYSDEKKLLNGTEETQALEKIANSILHRKEYKYVDNRLSDGKMRRGTKIFLYVKTDLLCESCSLANNGIYNKGKRNLLKTDCYVGYNDCVCGIYFEVRSYLNAVKNLIEYLDKN